MCAFPGSAIHRGRLHPGTMLHAQVAGSLWRTVIETIHNLGKLQKQHHMHQVKGEMKGGNRLQSQTLLWSNITHAACAGFPTCTRFLVVVIACPLNPACSWAPHMLRLLCISVAISAFQAASSCHAAVQVAVAHAMDLGPQPHSTAAAAVSDPAVDAFLALLPALENLKTGISTATAGQSFSGR